MFKVTARDQGHYKGPSGAFVTYCNISCFNSCSCWKPSFLGIFTFLCVNLILFGGGSVITKMTHVALLDAIVEFMRAQSPPAIIFMS